MKGKKMVRAWVSEDLAMRFKVEAIGRKLSVQEAVRRALELFIEIKDVDFAEEVDESKRVDTYKRK